MSLYNLLFGKNPDTALVLAIIGLKEHDIERFRDCGVTQDGVYVYTRTGGGNREEYQNKILTSSPYYRYDEDDGFDSTYATYYFDFPEEIKDDVISMLENIEEHGVSGNLIKWLNKTIGREPTETDKHHKKMQNSKDMFDNLIRNGDLTYPHNGHTCIILSDDGAKECFRLAEQDAMYYWAAPLKINVIRDDFKYDFYRKSGIGEYRVLIKPDKEWSIDKDAAERYLRLFGDEFPVAAEYFRGRWLK